MNDGNIAYYLKWEMIDLKREIEEKESYIKGAENNIDDWYKRIRLLKVHYTSLVNTAIAYGYEVEEDDIDE